MISKAAAKRLLGEIPLTAELYWHLRESGKPPRTGFSLEELKKRLPEIVAQAKQASIGAPAGKRVLIFGSLHYWIAHNTLLGLALAGLGHSVTQAYLPYGNFRQPINQFDLRRQNVYTQSVLDIASPVIKAISFQDGQAGSAYLPAQLQESLREISRKDAQYILQVEEVAEDSPLIQMRLERNTQAARAAFAWIRTHRPDVVIVPNGSIQEFGSVFQVGRYFGVPVVTYEFGEQRDRVWLAQDNEVMRQQTDELWAARGGKGISSSQKERVEKLLRSRQKGRQWENFSRQWQGTPSMGGSQVRKNLGLDDRPVVLLATNVIGDSLTLGRQVFSDNMTEWLVRTVHFFNRHYEAQLVVRIHPGELVTKGPSVADVVLRASPGGLPPHIHLIPADAEVNTYDLVEIADLGLVYTTTVGLEMAMAGLPVIVIGQTHYRAKGFTQDPETWGAYFDLLADTIRAPKHYRLTETQRERAWEYAYRFFFEYPQPFPWHLLYLWTDLDTWPLQRVLSEEGLNKYGNTFRYLAGELIDWDQITA